MLSERLWNLNEQFGMSGRLAHGVEGSKRSNRPPAPSVFDALFQVSHGHEVIAESR